MKNSIRYWVIAVILGMMTTAHAQEFGLRAGFNLAKYMISDDDEKYSDELDMKPGLHVGLTMEKPITDNFSFEVMLLLNMKGSKYSTTEVEGSNFYKIDSWDRLFYFDLPLLFKAYGNLGGPRLYAGAGPYLGFGLSGKSRTELTINGETETEEDNISWGTSAGDDDFKRFDLGFYFGGGIEFKAVSLGVSYGLGLLNTSPYSDNGFKLNHRVLGITAGYKFGGPKTTGAAGEQ